MAKISFDDNIIHFQKSWKLLFEQSTASKEEILKSLKSNFSKFTYDNNDQYDWPMIPYPEMNSVHLGLPDGIGFLLLNNKNHDDHLIEDLCYSYLSDDKCDYPLDYICKTLDDAIKEKNPIQRLNK